MPKAKHDEIARKLAERLGTTYNRGQGADIRGQDKVVEVEVDRSTFSEGKRQLRGYRVPRYLGIPEKLVPEALEATAGTKIGVIDENGRIHKPASRQKPRPR